MMYEVEGGQTQVKDEDERDGEKLNVAVLPTHGREAPKQPSHAYPLIAGFR